MKTPDDIRVAVTARLDKSWAESVVAAAQGGPDPRWPWRITLTVLSGRELNEQWSDTWRWILQIKEWADDNDCRIDWTSKRAGSATRSIPARITVADIDTAAHIAGTDWARRLAAARSRVSRLHPEFANTLAPGVATLACAVDDVDFDLACRAADWFRLHDATGLTARQVPITGLHAKWLDRNTRLVCGLAGRAGLGLVQRPSRVRFSYLDPDWLAAGGRRRDSISLDEPDMAPAYRPDVVVICENKDTALFFPPVAGGIVIEGEGDAAGRLPRIRFIRNCGRVLYWGDIDPDGFQILNDLRQRGIPAESILMDEATLTAFADYAAPTYANGTPLSTGTPPPTPWLTVEERLLLEQITNPAWSGARRIEQERIPFEVPARAVAAALASAPTSKQGPSGRGPAACPPGQGA